MGCPFDLRYKCREMREVINQDSRLDGGIGLLMIFYILLTISHQLTFDTEF